MISYLLMLVSINQRTFIPSYISGMEFEWLSSRDSALILMIDDANARKAATPHSQPPRGLALSLGEYVIYAQRQVISIVTIGGILYCS